MNYKEEIDKLYKEKQQYIEAYRKYVEIEEKVDKLTKKYRSECKHENAYWYEQSYEGRTYDMIFCPECGKAWEERIYAGRHEYQSKEDYLNKTNRIFKED